VAAVLLPVDRFAGNVERAGLGWWPLAAYVAWSRSVCFLYWSDKRAGGALEQRTPENVLQPVLTAWGLPALCWRSRLLRHKTARQSISRYSADHPLRTTFWRNWGLFERSVLLFKLLAIGTSEPQRPSSRSVSS